MEPHIRHKVVRIFITAVIFLAFGIVFYPFLTPLLLAILVAFALDPMMSKYTAVKSHRTLPTVVFLFAFFAVISIPMVFVIYRVIVKSKEYLKVGLHNTTLYQSLHSAITAATGYFSQITESLSNGSESVPDLAGMVASAGTWFVTWATAFLTNLPEFILSLFVFTVALYFFLTESRRIKAAFIQLDLLKPSELNHIIRIVQRSSYVSFVSTAVIGVVQALTVAIAALIFGYKEFLIVFVITFFASMIPVIGAAPVAAALSIFSFAQGEVGGGIGLAVAAIIAGSIDNILKPYIVASSDDDLHPVVSLLAIIGAVIVYGIPGLILGPILTQLAFKIIPILFHEEKTEVAVTNE